MENNYFDKRYKHSELTDLVICSFYNVYNRLGSGFLEKVYENALAIELGKNDVPFQLQAPINVFYEGRCVGEFFADILVNQKVIVEIKAAKALASENEAQLLNYLKATQIEVGLLLNFGPKPQVKRMALSPQKITG